MKFKITHLFVSVNGRHQMVSATETVSVVGRVCDVILIDRLTYVLIDTTIDETITLTITYSRPLEKII